MAHAFVDLLARDTTGRLWTYPGNGKGAFGTRRLVGGGWNSMTRIQAVGDLDGDGKSDLVARDTKGQLWMYPGTGRGGFGTRKLIGTGGWSPFTTLLGVGNMDEDAHLDLLAAESARTGGQVVLYYGHGGGSVSSDGLYAYLDNGDSLY